MVLAVVQRGTALEAHSLWRKFSQRRAAPFQHAKLSGMHACGDELKL